MKQFIAILFVVGVTTLFGLAKGEIASPKMPVIKNLDEAITNRDSSGYFDNLTVTLTQNIAELKWISETGINSKQFEIQRSTDGVTFATIGIIFTIDEVLKTKSYIYKDNLKALAKGVFSYRIKQVNVNETFSTSAAVALQKK